MVISVKYCLFILRADNRGEGGIIALLALLGVRRIQPGSWRVYLAVFGLVGTALLYADGTITPAISVLSAVEGLSVDNPHFQPYVLPITLAILVVLFSAQRMGTSHIGRIFGPFMLIWFAVLGLLGIGSLLAAPEVLAAINPSHASVSCSNGCRGDPRRTGRRLSDRDGRRGALCGSRPFRPCPDPQSLVRHRAAGPDAELLRTGRPPPHRAGRHREPISSGPGLGPLSSRLLATLATVIASQAVITGAFSLTQQAIQLGFLPRMRVIHTSRHERGHVYVPLVNWILATLTFIAVLGFGSSSRLAGAYGLAVSLDMVITTILATFVALHWGHKPVWSTF